MKDAAQLIHTLVLAVSSFAQGCQISDDGRDRPLEDSFRNLPRIGAFEYFDATIRRALAAARWREKWGNRSVKEECLSKMILFGEASARHVLSNYARHYHEERNHQGTELSKNR